MPSPSPSASKTNPTHSTYCDVLGAVTRDPHPAPGCDAIELGTMRYVSVANPWLLDKYTTDGQVDWEAMPALRFGPRDGLQDEGLKTHVQKTHP